jgi:hypothetical protein
MSFEKLSGDPDAFLNYQPVVVREPKPFPSAALVVVYVLVLAVTAIAIRIEFLNAAIGYYMPRQFDTGKWRGSKGTDEASWREWVSGEYNPPDGRPIEGELTTSLRAQMVRDIAEAKANNAARNFVGTFGLLQYPLVIMTFFVMFGVFTDSPSRRLILALAPAIALTMGAGCLAWYRGYFTSLGI